MSSKYLFIIESPGKQKKIQSFLGTDYNVIATKGHIRGLPPNKIGVDFSNFTPEYVTLKGKHDVINNIKNLAKKVEKVYIATDKDREGEGIAYGIANILPRGVPYQRVIYNSITKNEILNGIENASDIDYNLVNSYETRTILDKIVGFKCSYLVKKGASGKSAGRVQSVGLRLIADREKEIQAFIPEEYWDIKCKFKNQKDEEFWLNLKKPDKYKIKDETGAKEICKKIEDSETIVSECKISEKQTKPFAPFTTSTLYQSASNILGWSSSKTASVAQQLYNNSYITYIRTDSTYIVPQEKENIRNEIITKYGNNYKSNEVRFYGAKKGAQQAHESIRPTEITNSSVGGYDENRLYQLILKRTIASQMSNMIKNIKIINADNGEYKLSGSGSELVFDGFSKSWNYVNSDDVYLPDCEEGEILKLIDIKKEQKFTTPPPRFTEQKLIKELEKRGIGRPSTYATIIKILFDREYVEKEKKALKATEKGVNVSDFLQSIPFCFIDYDFTKEMEENLDKIANNSAEKYQVLSEFWNTLSQDISNAKQALNKKEYVDKKCPSCGGNLIYKRSNFGKFIGCENYSNKEIKCKYIENLDGTVIEKKEKEYSQDFTCPRCGSKMIKRQGKKVEFWGCSKYPKCKGIRQIDGEEMKFKKKPKKKK